MFKQITSLQNPAVKKLLQLQERSRIRKKEGLFIIEGKREIGLAQKGGYQVTEIYFCPELFSEAEIPSLKHFFPQCSFTVLSREVYEKTAYRGSTEGIISVAVARELSLENLILDKPDPLILVAESPEKPGNLGALLRSADAANLDAVLIADPKTDIFNPNIIRSSVGCVFTTSIAVGTSRDIISFLRKKQIPLFGAALQASVPYHKVDFTGASAIAVGTEATGLSNQWLENTSRNILIPMQGEIDSMNVSVAAGILIFEAKRQRNFR